VFAETIRVVLSYNKHSPKPFYQDYIYLKFRKKSKRQTRWNGFALLKNDITGSEAIVKILDT